MSLWGILTSKPVQELASAAAKAAGRWVVDKVVDSAKAQVEKAKALANAVDNAARTAVRSVIHGAADLGSNAVGAASEAYQGVKKQVVAGAERVGNAVDATKEFFGLETPSAQAAPCPLCETLGEAPDGALMVPSDACPADAIPPGGDMAAALARAKAASVPSSRACCANKSEAERNRTIIYVNGIMTSPEAHCKTLRKLRAMTCGRVVGVLNRSENAVTDIVRTNDARMRIKREIDNKDAKPSDYAGFTPAVKTTKDVLALQAVSGEKTTVFAHSEGGAITSLAAVRAKTMLAKGGAAEDMANIDIISMGAAAPAWPDGPNYTHYVHVQDAVPNTVGLGDSASRPGTGAKMVYFGGRDGNYETIGKGDKKPYLPITPRLDPISDHYADSSYLPYINQQGGGCLDQP